MYGPDRGAIACGELMRTMIEDSGGYGQLKICSAAADRRAHRTRGGSDQKPCAGSRTRKRSSGVAPMLRSSGTASSPRMVRCERAGTAASTATPMLDRHLVSTAKGTSPDRMSTASQYAPAPSEQ